MGRGSSRGLYEDLVYSTTPSFDGDLVAEASGCLLLSIISVVPLSRGEVRSSRTSLVVLLVASTPTRIQIDTTGQAFPLPTGVPTGLFSRDLDLLKRTSRVKGVLPSVDVAQQVWGKDISALKGKTTRSKPVPVKGNAMRIPRQFLQRHKHVLLTADIFLLTKFHFW